MLSDEEKKAVKELTEIKELVEEDLKNGDYNVTATLAQIDLESLVIVLNLIEKQSKEIEELKEKNKTLKNLQNDTNRLYTEMIERKNYFERELQKLKDKIKAKIEEVKDGTFDAEIVLRSLLEKE